MYAQPFTTNGEEDVQGDSCFPFQTIQIKEITTFEDLQTQWFEQMVDEGERPTGFWILSDEHHDLIDAMCENFEGRNAPSSLCSQPSVCDAVNRSAKLLAKYLAIKTVTP